MGNQQSKFSNLVGYGITKEEAIKSFSYTIIHSHNRKIFLNLKLKGETLCNCLYSKKRYCTVYGCPGHETVCWLETKFGKFDIYWELKNGVWKCWVNE